MVIVIYMGTVIVGYMMMRVGNGNRHIDDDLHRHVYGDSNRRRRDQYDEGTGVLSAIANQHC